MLNPNSPMPLYHQLADILTEQIRSGAYQPGDVIPSETGLAKDYGIGRPTVRQAMDALVRKGLIERKRGSGTFVKDQGPAVNIFSLAGTSQAFLTQGIKPEIRIIEPAGIKAIQDGQGNPFHEQQAYFFSRLTLVKSEPVVLEDIYLHAGLFHGLEKYDFKKQSLSAVVSDTYYMTPDTGHQAFKLVTLSSEKSAYLGLTSSDFILEVQRTLDFSGYPGAVFSRLFCRTDQFAFSQTIRMEPRMER